MKMASLFIEEAKKVESPVSKMVFQAQRNHREGKQKEGRVDKYWKIINKAEDAAEILIYEQIGKSFWDDSGVGAKQFAEDLKGLSVNGVKNLVVGINSPGGSVFEGIAIYNMLKNFPGVVDTRNDGIAASISSVVFMAGKKRSMPANTMFMMHDPSGVAMGTATDMKKMAEVLDKVKMSIMSVYMEGTGLTEEEVGALMSEETWFTGQEAKEIGFANDMTAAVNIAATFDLAQFKNAPVMKPSIIGDISNIVVEQKKEEVKMDLTKLKAEYPGLVAAIVDETKGPLVSEVEGLKDKIAIVSGENERLSVENKELAKGLALEKANSTKAQAEGIKNGILAESSIPDVFGDKVAGMVDHSKHLDADGSLNTETFTAAFTAEVKDWETRLAGSMSQGTGVGESRTDIHASTDSDEAFGRELARSVGRIRSDK